MRQMIVGFLLLLATTLSGQQVTFGDPFALTNTRYGTAATPTGTLVTNGREFFLFWPSAGGVRATKLVSGERRGGRVVLETDETNNLGDSIVWTGTHFLIVHASGSGLVGRLLDANADPIGAPFTILDSSGTQPRLATNGNVIQMLYRNGHQLRVATLAMNGTPKRPTYELLAPIPLEGLTDFDVTSNGFGFAATASTEHAVYSFTFDGEGEKATHQLLFSDLGNYITYVAAGTNGRDYIAAWAGTQSGAAASVSADGGVGPAIAFEQQPGMSVAFGSDLALTWTGTTFAIAYRTADPERLRIAHMDNLVRRFLGHEETTGRQPSIATAAGMTLLASVPATTVGPASFEKLPLAENTPEIATYAAAEQVLLSTTASFDATLTIWKETSDQETRVYAGLRERNGEWSERMLAPGSEFMRALAASNGREFVVAITQNSETTAYFLDARGRPVSSAALPFETSAIAWNGTSYIIGAASPAAVATLSPSGAVSAPVVLSDRGVDTALTTDGVNTVAAWIDIEPCPVLCPFSGEVIISRLDANLQRLDKASLLPGTFAAVDVTAAWDGTRFIVAWSNGHEIQYARVNPSGPSSTVVVTLYAGILSDSFTVQAAPVAGAVAVAWSDREGHLDQAHHLAILGTDASTRLLHFDAEGHAGVSRVSAAPDGRIAFVTYGAQPLAPHHGSERVLMAVGRINPIAPPGQPSIDANLVNRRIRLNWTAPSQPFGGYRIEYRIGDGSWHELEPWFDPESSATSLQFPLRRGVQYQFRIRAWNDAGPGAYSEVAKWSLPKRRAVK